MKCNIYRIVYTVHSTHYIEEDIFVFQEDENVSIMAVRAPWLLFYRRGGGKVDASRYAGDVY